MTTPSKIHRQDPDQATGVAVCGRKAAANRMTGDPAAVTCVVCIVNQPTSSGAPTPRPRNVVDALADVAIGSGTSLTPTVDPAHQQARTAASEALIARHLDEFLGLYRAALAAVEADK